MRAGWGRAARRTTGAALLAALLAGCGGHYRPVSDAPVRLGRPYVVRGVTYTPAVDSSYDMLGYASWYGGESGNRTALGERFRAKWVTAAHPTLPLPSYVEVTALDTGRVILLRVNDRGPFARDRLIDLSRGAAELLGVRARGHVAVRVRVVEPPERDRARLRRGRAAAPRPDVSPEVVANLRAQLDTGLRAIGR